MVKLNPLIFSCFAEELACSDQANYFVNMARERILSANLNEKWIKDINNFTDYYVKSLDKELPEKYTIDSLKVKVIKVRKKHRKYYNHRHRDIICVDENGWKYWFRYVPDRQYTLGIMCPKVGDTIILDNVQFSGHKPGISFIFAISKIWLKGEN